MNNGIKDQTVTMAHGAGGRQTSELIDNIFAAHFANPDLTADDAAVLNPPVGKMAVSTDGFIVSPASPCSAMTDMWTSILTKTA